MAEFIPFGGDLAGNLVAGLIGNNSVDAFAVADANSQTGKLLRHLIGPAFDEFKSLADMNAVVASAAAMNAVVASATAMNAVAASATAMNVVAASATAMNIALKSSIARNAMAASATARSAIISKLSTLNDTTKFSKTTTYVEYKGNGTGTYTAPANSLLLITQFYAYVAVPSDPGAEGTVIITAVNGNYQIMNRSDIKASGSTTTTTINLNDISIGNFTVYRNLNDPNSGQVSHKVSFTIYTAI